MKKLFKQIEEHLTQFFQFTIRHEICEDIYTFSKEEDLIEALHKVGDILDNYDGSYNVLIRKDSENDYKLKILIDDSTRVNKQT